MARLQVLYLPGSDSEQPFALVMDRVSAEEADGTSVAPEVLSGLEHFANKAGARAVFVTNLEIEVA